MEWYYHPWSLFSILTSERFLINCFFSWEILSILFVASIAFTYLSKVAANYLGIIDVPNARSAHKKPTPLLGGIGIFLSFLVGYLNGTLTSVVVPIAILLTPFSSCPRYVVSTISVFNISTGSIDLGVIGSVELLINHADIWAKILLWLPEILLGKHDSNIIKV